MKYHIPEDRDFTKEELLAIADGFNQDDGRMSQAVLEAVRGVLDCPYMLCPEPGASAETKAKYDAVEKLRQSRNEARKRGNIRTSPF